GREQAEPDHDGDVRQEQHPALPGDRQAGAVAVALRPEPWARIEEQVQQGQSPFRGGRPRLAGSAGGTLIPRRASASRSSISISALTERSSCAATRSTAAWSAGSRRRAKAFFGVCGTAPALLVERARVDHRIHL